MENKRKIVIIDDDEKIAKALAVRLTAAGYETFTSYNGVAGLLLSQIKKPDLIISDVYMPTGGGFSVAYRFKETVAGIPVIFLTASKKPNLKELALKLGAAGYMEKPYESDLLLKMIAELLQQARVPASISVVPQLEIVNNTN